MPKIDLEGLAPLAEDFTPGPPPPRPDPQLEIMLTAMESAKGLSIDVPDEKAAHALRFKFYRSRQAQQKKANYSLDGLIFTIRAIEGGWEVRIVKSAPLVVKEL